MGRRDRECAAPFRYQLGFGEVGVGFDFEDLLGVAFGVSADEENEFVGIPLGNVGAAGAVDGVIAEAGSGFEEVPGFGAALQEMIDGTLRGAEAVVGLDRLRSLDFVGAIFDTDDDGGVNPLNIAAWSGGSLHDVVGDIAANEVFGSGDVFHAFGDGPAVRSGFEVPLSVGEPLGGVENVFLGGLQEFESFCEISIGELLSPGGHRTTQREQ